MTCLTLACLRKRTEVVRYLCSLDKLDLKMTVTRAKNTALHIAAYYDYIDIVLILLHAGADKTIPNYYGRDAANEAWKRGRSLVGKIISKFDASMQEIDLSDQMGVSIPSVIQSNGLTNLYKFKTDPATSSNLMVFVLPCEGKIDWFIANSTQVTKASDLTTANSLFSFIFPQIKYKSRAAKDDIPNVVTPFYLKGSFGILPGNSTYYLKVTNSGNVKARYNLLYSTSTNPYPILPSSNSIRVKQNSDQIELSWNPIVENAAYINYCVYAHSEQEHDEGDVHGSACAVFADSELQGCTSSSSFVLSMKKSATYHIDVVATRKDNGRSWAYIGQEYVFKMNSAVGTFNMTCFLLLLTIQLVTFYVL